jgi:hypothetical protein
MSESATHYDLASDYLHDAIRRFRRLKEMADKAIAQVDDEAFFVTISPEGNSVALIVKHMAGNMRSRWREFLTTDGEKPDRHRDSEFKVDKEDTRQAIMARWEAGWRYLFEAVEPLMTNDLGKTIRIRQRPHSIVQAINRQLAHYAYHVGQIVFLAKHLQAGDWQWLSIPPGQSEQYNTEVSEARRDYHGWVEVRGP